MPSTVSDKMIVLPDGRRLGYCEYGAPSGIPVIALHGTPGSRLKFAPAHQDALRLNLRLICPDRWGYGLTDAPRHPTLPNYAADIRALADRLDLAQLSILGVSGGGPFALAIAATLPDRVTMLALVSPVGRLAEHGAPSIPMTWFHRFTFYGLARTPGAIRLIFSGFRTLLRVAPDRAIALASMRASQPDRALLSKRQITNNLTEAFAAGLKPSATGPVVDMKLFSRAWGLDLHGVRAPTRMWLGTTDNNIPIQAARALVRDGKNVELVELEGHGHYWITENIQEVLSWLKRPA